MVFHSTVPVAVGWLELFGHKLLAVNRKRGVGCWWLEIRCYRISHIEMANNFGVFSVLLQLSEAERSVREERKQTGRQKPSQNSWFTSTNKIITIHKLESINLNLNKVFVKLLFFFLHYIIFSFSDRSVCTWLGNWKKEDPVLFFFSLFQKPKAVKILLWKAVRHCLNREDVWRESCGFTCPWKTGAWLSGTQMELTRT